MMKSALLLTLACLCASACAGSRPVRYGDAKFGFSGVIVRGRIITPTGEIKEGALYLNLESDAERYRLPFEPGETVILRIEPDRYRLFPMRGFFGFVQRDLTLEIAGRKLRVPFPRDILRKPPLEIKPTKLMPIGILEARLLPLKKGRRPEVKVRLDDSIDARRELVQEMIDKMMDPQTPVKIRSSSISWTRALEQALSALQSEEEAALSYKPGK